MQATATIEEQLAKLIEMVEALTRENKILRDENALLKRGLFGRRSERMEPGQLDFFVTPSEPSAADTPAPAAPKEKKGHGRAPFSPNLVRETVTLDLDQADPACSCCGKPMQRMGEEVTERGHCIPARMVVKRYVRAKWGCPDGHEVQTADLPDAVIDGGKYEASVYAHVATSKYQDHLPLHRLQGIFKRYGSDLSKQSMWDMIARLDELVAQPVLKQMRLELLEEDVLHADETPVTMRLEGSKGTKQGWVWGWRNLHRPDKPSKALVEFRTSRGRDGPTAFLGDWSGTLIVDGFASYDEVARLNGIVRAGCWAHARRKLKDALDTGSEDAAEPLALVNELFKIEKVINKLVQAGAIGREEQVEQRRVARESESAQVIDSIYACVARLQGQRSTLPKSKLGKALTYLVNQAQPLTTFLKDPRIPIHNNDSERDLRHLAVGRKNWLVFGSERGGQVACRMYSMVLSCTQNGVNPEAYFEDVLMRVATTPESEIATLTPWAWTASK